MMFKPYEEDDDKYLNYWFMWVGLITTALVVTTLLGWIRSIWTGIFQT